MYRTMVTLGFVVVSSMTARAQTHAPNYLFNFSFQIDQARELFVSGQKFYDENNFVEAEKQFREVLRRFPRNRFAERADYYLIRTLTQLGRRAEAIGRINAFARQYPKSSWQDDVRELRIRLTNQVSPEAESLLLAPVPPSPFPAPPAPPSQAAPPQPAPPPAPAVRIGRGAVKVTTFNAGQNAAIDSEISLQQEIMRAVFRNDAERGMEIAAERLKNDPADPVVLSNLHMVAASLSSQALPILVSIARGSTNLKARKDAIFWIGQSKVANKDSAVDTIVGLVPSLAEDEAETAAFTLGQMITEKALNGLASIARDKSKSEKVRNTALYWIGESKLPNRVALLEDVYKNAMDNTKIRLQALFALAETRDPQAAAVLGNIAASDPELEVKRQAVFWLGRMKNTEAGQELEKLLRKR